MKKPTITITEDSTREFQAWVKSLQTGDVLVGIPEVENKRKNKDVQGPINNAALLFINEFGSPANNIPARPVMKIGIKNAQDQITDIFKRMAQDAWKQGQSAITTGLNKAGFVASNSVKRAINSQEGIQEPAESTMKARKSRGFRGIKALVVTGQMRNAITFVTRYMNGTR